MTETSCCAELTSEDGWNIFLQREFLNMSVVTTQGGDFLFLNRAVWNPANWLLRLVFLRHKCPSVFHFVFIPNPFLYISTSDTRCTVYKFDKLICCSFHQAEQIIKIVSLGIANQVGFSYSVRVNIVKPIRYDECQPIMTSPIGSSTSVLSGITAIFVFWSQIWPYLDDRAG